MNRIAIFGSGGMLGYAVSNYFEKAGNFVLNLNRSTYDIAKDPFDAVPALLQKNEIKAVINCAGVIKPQIAKMSVEDVLKVNSIFPRNLANLCQKSGIPLIHITTDCVYSGAKGQYDESDFFDATDVYGMTKNAGEPLNSMVLRTSIVGEEKGQARSLLEWMRSQAGKEVNGFTNHLWNGVTTVQLAKSIDNILQKNMYERGIFHIHSPEPVTKFELLNIFNDVYKLSIKVNKATATELCDRTMKSQKSLSSTLVKISIREQVQEMKNFFNSLN